MLNLYAPLLVLHTSLAFVSPVLFSLRALRSVRGLEPAQGWLRVVPHAVDTLLLLAGFGLAFTIRQDPFVDTWLTVKLVALVAYIAVGHVAVRRARTRGAKIMAWLLALAIVLYIYGVAFTKDPGLGVLFG